MPSTRQLALHDNLIDGVDTTQPAHLIGQKWRTQHNMRLTPELVQVPHKVAYTVNGSSDIRWIGTIPNGLYGYGAPRYFSPTTVYDGAGNIVVSGLVDDGNWRRWSVIAYQEQLYYSNDLNPIRNHTASSDVTLSDAPQARYILVWYDHLVAAHVTYRQSYLPDQLRISDLYNFNTWYPDKAANEADFYDFVEWQQTDYPLSGITGIGLLHGVLYVYTPTAIIPMRYVGLPKVFQIQDSGIITHVGNGYPWTLVCLDTIHLFYDGIEKSFFAFDGQQVIPIGEPIRTYINANLTTDPVLSRKMYGYIDVDNREVWWPFVSTASSGNFDKAVVFNYRYKKWYTASVENIQSFGGTIFLSGTVAQLPGQVSGLTGTCGQLGQNQQSVPRLFGSGGGQIYREELTTDAAGVLVAQDNPQLESADFIYGDIRTVKENDLMIINATFGAESASPQIQVQVAARQYLSDPPTYVVQGNWVSTQQDGQITYPASAGRVLRYYFTALNSRRLKFSAFSDGVYAKLAEK